MQDFNLKMRGFKPWMIALKFVKKLFSEKHLILLRIYNAGCR
jgi:hypothetical protein